MKEFTKEQKYDINKTLAKFEGIKILSLDEMKNEAERVWQYQPNCCRFMAGFSYDFYFNEYKQDFPNYFSLDILRKIELKLKYPDQITNYCYKLGEILYGEKSNPNDCKCPNFLLASVEDRIWALYQILKRDD